MWTTEQCAWLRAHLPDDAQGRVLDAIWKLLPGDPSPKDVFVVGKRKPNLNSVDDADRIARYVQQYEALVARFREYPTLDT